MHVTVIDSFIDYEPGSVQYQFNENDLKTVSADPKIDWLFTVESTPIYTSSSNHQADLTLRNAYYSFFDQYGVDLVFPSDNHNYQRTFPLKYNIDSSNNSIIVDKNQNNYKNNDKDDGVIT